MICPCGGRVQIITRILKSKAGLVEWFPDKADQALPVKLTYRVCRSCGRSDRFLTEIDPNQSQ
jgi:hypothetical protein